MKAAWLFTILFLACRNVHSQTLRVLAVQVPGDKAFPAAMQFFCTEKYSRIACQNDLPFATDLAPLSSRRPRPVVRCLGFRGGTGCHREPAPSAALARGQYHVIAQSLFSGPPDRRADLVKRFPVPLEQLLSFAISHKLGHALCHETDEGKAAVYPEQVRAGQFPICGRLEGPPLIVAYDASLTTLSVESFLRMQKHIAGTEATSRATEHSGEPALRSPGSC